jgi:hypothetical protein
LIVKMHLLNGCNVREPSLSGPSLKHVNDQDVNAMMWMCCGRGRPALEAARAVLKQPEMEGLQLYSFRAAAKRDRLYMRLDRASHQHHASIAFLTWLPTWYTRSSLDGQSKKMQFALRLH